MDKKYLKVLVLVAAALVVLAVFFLAKNDQDNLQQTVNNPSPQTPEVNQGDSLPLDWKTYSNKEYGFEIKYPVDFLVTELSDGKNVGIKFINEKESTGISFFPTGGFGFGAPVQEAKRSEYRQGLIQGEMSQWTLSENESLAIIKIKKEFPKGWSNDNRIQLSGSLDDQTLLMKMLASLKPL